MDCKNKIFGKSGLIATFLKDKNHFERIVIRHIQCRMTLSLTIRIRLASRHRSIDYVFFLILDHPVRVASHKSPHFISVTCYSTNIHCWLTLHASSRFASICYHSLQAYTRAHLLTAHRPNGNTCCMLGDKIHIVYI